MGKKSKRNSNKNSKEPFRKGQNKAAAPAIYDEVFRLLRANKYKEILKVESKYRHLDTFSDDPYEHVNVFTVFGLINKESSQEEACSDRAIGYNERAARTGINSFQDDSLPRTRKIIKLEIGMKLPFCIQRVVPWKKQSLRIDGYLKIVTVTMSQRFM